MDRRSSITSIVRAVLAAGPLRRADLEARTGLSQPTIAKLTRSLIDSGYLTETTAGGGPGRIGRPAAALDVRTDREFFAGVKVTAGELIGVVTDLRAVVRTTVHAPLGDARTPPDVVRAIARLVDGLGPVSGLGVSVAGDVDRTTGVARYEPFLGWHDVPLAALCTAATGVPTVADNDIRALTEAENWFGAGADARSFLLVAVGSGVTSGLVVDGRVLTGAHGVAGELGHVPIDRGGPKCYCGARGCLEAIASEPALLRRVAEAIDAPAVTLDRAIELARLGDPRVGEAFAEAGRAIGQAVGGVINLLGPELVVFSADHLDGFALLEPHIRAAITTHAYGAAARATITIRPLPFDRWARGAATVAIARHLTSVTI
ncbi:putative NBD/HSP70 family sugar kinase [Catenuloplanes nepalensis]|uniref:NBD/HSP70 family sugar kinase n=1 Tax=Catenuloplanes nepalensis TaxID=587533 RepID=A0ABT9MWM8_9ACTN|nr:ROK family protein [Catenuloplanes nepalensis]MDP9795852.1 putative NBD/HSP70 family sugar kinase [Catenuloplanes nepalensis]